MEIIELLPAPLQAMGPKGLSWAQWAALPLLFLVAWVVGFLLGRGTRAVLALLVRRTAAAWDDALVASTSGPLGLAWTLGVARLALPAVGLHGRAEEIFLKGLRTGFFVVVFWFLLRLVKVLGEVITSSAWAKGHPAGRSLVPLGARIVKIAVVGMAAVAVLADLGYPVASLVAGLGIGGLALALAGQKTVENLFGAFSIGVDQPFRVGDTIAAEGGVVGQVESIGLRSTRIRTPDRTVVTIPNGKLADQRVESFAARDRIRLSTVLALAHGARAAELRAVLAGFEEALRAEPRLWPDQVIVRLRDLPAAGAEVEVIAWFQTADYEEFRLIRQDVLLRFLEVLERVGVPLAPAPGFDSSRIRRHPQAQ